MKENHHERIYRDPIHNMIRLTISDAEDKLLADLIDAPEFQRLRRIKQLGLALFAYPCAEHSRFSHSLGAMHLAKRIVEKLSSKHKTARENSIFAKCAALLHDVGHGPFSHVFEKILKISHENFTVEIIKSEDTEISKILKRYSFELPEKIASVIQGTFSPRWVCQLISSQLDVDRMDYLLRDAHMTGVKYGIYDLEWIIESIEIDPQEEKIYVSSKGIHAVEDYIQGRHYMFKQVYFHRNLRSAEVVLSSLIQRAVDLVEKGETVWLAEATPFEKILRKQPLTTIEYLQMDDSDVVFHIKKWQQSKDKILADLSKRFIDRNFFKSFELDMNEEKNQEFLEKARTLVEKAELDPKYYFIEDIAKDEPYKIKDDLNKAIFVEVGHSRPQIKEISEISQTICGLQKYEIRRVFLPQEIRDLASENYKESNICRFSPFR